MGQALVPMRSTGPDNFNDYAGRGNKSEGAHTHADRGGATIVVNTTKT